jgi:hypothetical protein
VDSEILNRFILDQPNRLVIFFSSFEEWYPFYLDLRKCGWDFKYDSAWRTDISNFIIWIRIDKTLCFTSMSANEKPISLLEFRRSYNLYILV